MAFYCLCKHYGNRNLSLRGYVRDDNNPPPPLITTETKPAAVFYLLIWKYV